MGKMHRKIWIQRVNRVQRYCGSVERRKVHFHWLDVGEQMLIMRLVFTIIIINISLTIIIINIITKL